MLKLLQKWRPAMYRLKQSVKYSVITLALSFVLFTLNLVNNEMNSYILQRRPEGRRVNKSVAADAKRIIFWTTVFGRHTWGLPKGDVEQLLTCPERKKCILSTDRSSPLEGNALVFHMRDWYVIPPVRSPQQVYVMYGWESPDNRGSYYNQANDFYNWTMTYSKESDISFMYGYWAKLPKMLPDAFVNISSVYKKHQKGTAPIAWLASNCRSGNGREYYVLKLLKYIDIDIWGGCGRPCPKDIADCYKAIDRQYKFYLAFENSACLDYITEKAYKALHAGMVPIVLGGLSASDYVAHFPPNSYLDVRNFTSPKHLAAYVKMLDNNDERYLAYHAWRTQYVAREGQLGAFWCPLCAALHDKTQLSTPRNVDWHLFWNPNTMCDAKLVSQLLT